MRDDNPAARALLAVLFRQLPDHEFVGQAVVAESQDAITQELARQGIDLCHARHRAMKRGIEAGHLRERGIEGLDRFDGRHLLRKVVGKVRNQLADPSHELGSDQQRLPIFDAAAHQPVSYSV